jgi:cytochrome b561
MTDSTPWDIKRGAHHNCRTDIMTTTTTDTAETNSANYSSFAVVLHWAIFLCVIALFASAQYAETLPRPERGAVMDWHKTGGLIVLALAAIRIVWRLLAGAPELVPTSPITDKLAKASHGLLYLLLIALPLSGLAMTLSAGRGIALIGLPPLMEKSEQLSGAMHATHEIIFYVSLAIVAVHAVAALWHHYIRHDATLRRMVPWLRGRA